MLSVLLFVYAYVRLITLHKLRPYAMQALFDVLQRHTHTFVLGYYVLKCHKL